MMQNLGKKTIWTFILFLTIVLVSISDRIAVAQTKGGVETFYKGATIKFVVPNAPGGSYDLLARIIIPPLEKRTGAKVIVENMPGASGLVGGGYLYSLAKPDGLTIGLMPTNGMAASECLEVPEVKYKLEGFSYIGRVDLADRVVFASKGSGFKTISDMRKSTKTIRFGTVDPSSGSTVISALFIEAFGLNAKLIPGYKGNKEYMLATIAGRELDANATEIATFDEYVRRGEVTLITVLRDRRLPDFPEAPSVLETQGLSPESKRLLELAITLVSVGKMVMAPPNVSEDKRLFLEKALSASLEEPAVLDFAKKNGYNISPLSGKGCKELIDKVMKTIPKSERPKFRHIITQKYF